MRSRVFAVVCAAVLTTAVSAWSQENLVGKAAQGFTVRETINSATAMSLAECQGEVVLIKYWGIK
ncbi:MAG: hypothetical protein ACKVX7_09700 [Planctomycetota bacterium]